MRIWMTVVGLILGCAAVFSLYGCETVEGIRKDIGIDERVPPLRFDREPDIRIRVKKDATTLKIGSVSGSASQVAVRLVGDVGVRLLDAPLEVTRGVNGFQIRDAAGKVAAFAAGSNVEILASDPRASESDKAALSSAGVVVDSRSYPGFVVLVGNWGKSNDRFDVIADMPVETYLPSVLVHELFSQWPRQTFEAQAVASRTYALHERDRARKDRKLFDVESTTSDQVFNGGQGNLRSQEAVRATRGQVLTYNGRLIRAYFSSQCGGRPAAAELTWSGQEPHEFNQVRPLQGSARRWYCQQSPLYRWDVARSDSDVTTRLQKYGLTIRAPFGSMRAIREITPISRGPSGRPTRYKIVDRTGEEYEISPEQLRTGANFTVASLPPLTKETRLNSGDVEVEVWANQVRFRGRGWGHGVGMCQYCAKGMGEQSMDWATMIAEFYPEAKVQKAY